MDSELRKKLDEIASAAEWASEGARDSAAAIEKHVGDDSPIVVELRSIYEAICTLSRQLDDLSEHLRNGS